MCVTAASTRRMWMASAQQSIPSEAQPEDTAACLSGTLSRPTRPEEATQSRRGRLTQHSGTAPRHNWVQSQSGRACCAMGGGLRLRPSQLCSLLSCYRRGQAVLGVTAYVLSSLSSHPYGPSLAVRSYVMWDATRRELWETARLSTTHRLPVRGYWTQ